MPLCGFSVQMLKGLADFAQGLYKQAKKRAEEDGISVDEAVDTEIKEMQTLLEEIDRRYYKELRPQYGPEEAIKKILD